MSGPKITVYSVTPRIRAIVNNQIRCEQLSLACFAQSQETVRKLHSLQSTFDQQVRNIQLLMERTSEGADQLDMLLSLRAEINAEITQIKNNLDAHIPHISSNYNITEQSYAEKQAELMFSSG